MKKYLLDTNICIFYIKGSLASIKIVPIFHSLDLYAKEKARLRKTGTPIDDFDLLIGATAVTHHLTLVTNNSDHLKRIKGIVLEDWTK